MVKGSADEGAAVMGSVAAAVVVAAAAVQVEVGVAMVATVASTRAMRCGHTSVARDL